MPSKFIDVYTTHLEMKYLTTKYLTCGSYMLISVSLQFGEDAR